MRTKTRQWAGVNAFLQNLQKSDYQTVTRPGTNGEARGMEQSDRSHLEGLKFILRI